MLALVVQLVDAVVSSRLHSWIASVLVPGGWLCVAALMGTEVLDVSHSAHLIIEKAMDRRNFGGRHREALRSASSGSFAACAVQVCPSASQMHWCALRCCLASS